MRWLFAPGATLFMRMRNPVKLPLLAFLFTLPLALSLAAQPFALLSGAAAAPTSWSR